jgi:hypothetical protein
MLAGTRRVRMRIVAGVRRSEVACGGGGVAPRRSPDGPHHRRDRQAGVQAREAPRDELLDAGKRTPARRPADVLLAPEGLERQALLDLLQDPGLRAVQFQSGGERRGPSQADEDARCGDRPEPDPDREIVERGLSCGEPAAEPDEGAVDARHPGVGRGAAVRDLPGGREIQFSGVHEARGVIAHRRFLPHAAEGSRS